MATYTPNLTFSTGETAGATKINKLIDNILAVFPVGALIYIHQSPTATETTFMGKWIQCNGTLVSTTTYASLFAVVGTAYGSGSGTFGLPDLRGRPPVSIATSGHADVSAFGNSDGAVLASRRLKHAHTFANGSHTHTSSGTANTGGDHSHSGSADTYAGVSGSAGGVDDNELDTNLGTSYGMTSGGTSHSHTVSGLSYGSSSSVSLVGVNSSPLDQPAYIVAGCWYMAFS